MSELKSIKETFAIVPHKVICNKQLKGNTKCVLNYLYEKHNIKRKDNKPWTFSIGSIVQGSGLEEWTVKRVVKYLRTEKVLKHYSTNKEGNNRPTIYYEFKPEMLETLMKRLKCKTETLILDNETGIETTIHDTNKTDLSAELSTGLSTPVSLYNKDNKNKIIEKSKIREELYIKENSLDTNFNTSKTISSNSLNKVGIDLFKSYFISGSNNINTSLTSSLDTNINKTLSPAEVFSNLFNVLPPASFSNNINTPSASVSHSNYVNGGTPLSSSVVSLSNNINSGVSPIIPLIQETITVPPYSLKELSNYFNSASVTIPHPVVKIKNIAPIKNKTVVSGYGWDNVLETKESIKESKDKEQEKIIKEVSHWMGELKTQLERGTITKELYDKQEQYILDNIGNIKTHWQVVTMLLEARDLK